MENNRFVIAVYVDNTAGVLTRVTAMFTRRGFNIDALTVGETERSEYSRITIAMKGDVYVKEQLIIYSMAKKLESVPTKAAEFEDAYVLYLYNSTSYSMYLQYASMIESFGRTAEQMYAQLRITYAFDSVLQTLLTEDGYKYEAALQAYQKELRNATPTPAGE